MCVVCVCGSFVEDLNLLDAFDLKFPELSEPVTEPIGLKLPLKVPGLKRNMAGAAVLRTLLKMSNILPRASVAAS